MMQDLESVLELTPVGLPLTFLSPGTTWYSESKLKFFAVLLFCMCKICSEVQPEVPPHSRIIYSLPFIEMMEEVFKQSLLKTSKFQFFLKLSLLGTDILIYIIFVF